MRFNYHLIVCNIDIMEHRGWLSAPLSAMSDSWYDRSYLQDETPLESIHTVIPEKSIRWTLSIIYWMKQFLCFKICFFFFRILFLIRIPASYNAVCMQITN